MDFTILHFAIHIVWRANVICTYRKSGIARKTTVAYPELRLKGFGKNQEGEVENNHKRLLGRWSYFELQKDIEYKAAMAGIKVLYVNPAYTSQTCHVCGNEETVLNEIRSFAPIPNVLVTTRHKMRI